MNLRNIMDKLCEKQGSFKNIKCNEIAANNQKKTAEQFWSHNEERRFGIFNTRRAYRSNGKQTYLTSLGSGTNIAKKTDIAESI